MRLFPGQDDDDDGGLDIDMDDADTQELEAVAYRFVQIVPDRCEALASKMAHLGINHPVIFLCDVADHFGLAIARKISIQELIIQALQETPEEFRPGIIVGADMDELESREPTIYDAIRGRLDGLLGFFPIVVAAKGGCTVFPFPFKLKEKSKFRLFPSE